jgi:SAM-dependent methyltransferase
MILENVQTLNSGVPTRSTKYPGSLQLPQNHLQYCPICESPHLVYRFISQGYPIAQCKDCELLLTNPQPSRQIQLKEIESHGQSNPLRAATSKLYFEQLKAYRGAAGGTLLLLDTKEGGIVQEATSHGYATTELNFSATFEEDLNRLGQTGYLFDVCMLVYTLEKMPDPIDTLNKIRALLKSDGVLLLVTPSLDSWSARLLNKNWPEFRPEHLFYFDLNSIRNLLYKTNFHKVSITSEKRLTNLKHLHRRLSDFNWPKLAALLKIVNVLMPAIVGERDLTMAASGMVVLAQPGVPKSQPKLSVVLPVFNEKTTFSTLMGQLAEKQMPGLDIELIIVESNSADGTRDDVLKYQNHPRVKVILQDRPQGKGFAVRTGFEYMTGDYVLIQDADLEYDLNDYESLLQPLINYQKTFVIGSRHSKSKDSWKIREFNDSPILATFFNLGHIIFLFLLNMLYYQKLNDPFSMFKVFRRDCIYGLTFECNRFDFDFELVIKLIRNGCKPFEIPVNYSARSLQEGKKVSMLRDPLTWIRALIKYRFAPLGKK